MQLDVPSFSIFLQEHIMFIITLCVSNNSISMEIATYTIFG